MYLAVFILGALFGVFTMGLFAHHKAINAKDITSTVEASMKKVGIGDTLTRLVCDDVEQTIKSWTEEQS